MDVPRKNLGYFKEISRVFQESHKGDSGKIEGCFNGVLSGNQRMLQGSFKGDSTKIKGGSKIPSMVIQGSFKCI